MKVVLIRKLAERVDGVDLSKACVGEVMSLSRHEAELLIAEGWAQQWSRRWAQAASAPLQRPEFPGIAPTIDRIRELREELELERMAQQDRRRAEDRFREELHDSRARTLTAR